MNYLKNILLIIVVLISIYLLFNIYQNSFNPHTFVNNTEVTTKKLSKYEETVLSESPKIIYIKNFLPEDDLINHFILLANNSLAHILITHIH